MILNGKEGLNTEEIVALAKEAGFDHAAPIAMEALVCRDEVRAMCSADLCKSYGRSWSCPPACGSPERANERVRAFGRGVIVQTSGDVADGFDIRAIGEIHRRHQKTFETFVRQIRSLYPDCLPMGAGACTLCRRCTYPDRPCRHPDRMFPSMEAYGLLVSDVCLRSGLEYNYGSDKMTFTSCVLIDRGGGRA